MNHSITTRTYQLEDADDLVAIYYNTIHHINCRDYSKEQIDAWAPAASLEMAGWIKKWANLPPIVAEKGNTIVGFAEFEPNGHIDCFYVHHEFQNKGVGRALMSAIEVIANTKMIPRIYAEVSITAKPFFEKSGFKCIKEQQVSIRNCVLTNFLMEKLITPGAC